MSVLPTSLLWPEAPATNSPPARGQATVRTGTAQDSTGQHRTAHHKLSLSFRPHLQFPQPNHLRPPLRRAYHLSLHISLPASPLRRDISNLNHHPTQRAYDATRNVRAVAPA